MMKLSLKPRKKKKKTERIQSPLARVSKKRPCAICKKPDWCSYSVDGSLALCMREATGSVKQADNGAYVHNLTPKLFSEDSAVSAAPIRDYGKCGSGLADADRRNAVYTYMLENCLILKPEHGEHLLNERGLADTVIAAKLYASAPFDKSLWEDACKTMRSHFGDKLAGVPGFFKEGERWQMPRYDGFFIPVRDAQGRIVALQIRGSFDSRYIWFSTPPDKYQQGTSSGAPTHFVKPDLVKQSGHAFITEGALKGDIIGEYAEEAVIALASATAFDSDEIGSELKNALPELRKVTIAYDADWQSNKAVKDALRRLIHALRAVEFDVSVRIWNISLGKGYDDALLAVERAAENVK